ncbi:MAG: MBL fold metallo-hydrolase [Candidatus Nanosalina sp.]
MKVEVLGNVQDGGVPHLGCDCDVCVKARENPSEAKYVESILLKENDEENTARYLVNATPDIRQQVRWKYLDGIFIPHEGLGHITGLQFFGQEGPDISELSVYCCEAVEDYMMKNDPYRFLIDRNNIQIHDFNHGDIEEIRGGEIESIQFHHPHLNHDTTAYMIHGPEKKIFYLADITDFTREIEEKVEEADIAIIDGTFWSEGEIGRFEEVPHPPIRRSLDQFSDVETDIYFTHMNHTNPVLRKGSEERKELRKAGFEIVERGDSFTL